MADFVIRRATILDGTGTPGFVGDVGVREGRIAEVGPHDLFRACENTQNTRKTP